MAHADGKNVLNDQVEPERIDSHTYEFRIHHDWTMGPVLHGGSIAAVIHKAAEVHFNSTLAKLLLPDLHTLHIEFLRFCSSSQRIRITAQDLKFGKASSLIQLSLTQGGDTKAIALATATNFDVQLGPTLEFDSRKHISPRNMTIETRPDFAKIERGEPDDQWILNVPNGLLGVSNRLRYLYTKAPYDVDGMIHSWQGFKNGERMHAVHLTLLGDMFGSFSDTLLRNNGVYDTHRIHRLTKEWAEKHPGKEFSVPTGLEDAAKAELWNSTLVFDIEFKRRPPKHGYDWLLSRCTTTTLLNGRADLRVDLYDRDFQPVAYSRQAILVLENERRWKQGKDKASDKKTSAAKL